LFLRAFSTTPTKTVEANPEHIRGLRMSDIPVPPDVRDLSRFHLPVGDLFGQLPTVPQQWNKWRISDAQVDFYLKNGYLSNVQVLSESDCDRILEDYKGFLDEKKPHRARGLFYEFHSNQSGDPNNAVLHALGHWRITPLFHDLIFHPGLTVPTSQLIGADVGKRKEGVAVQFWHDQLFAKPPHHGGNVAWHQDYSYWTRSVPMNHMTVHLALDAQTPENGTLMFVPGSHRWSRQGKPLPITSGDFSDMDSIQSVLSPEEKVQWKPVPALLKKGQVSFHHPLMVHGSYPNRSDRPRRAAVVNYFGQGTKSITDQELLDGVPVVPKGQPITGPFFPLVFHPDWVRTVASAS